MVNRIFPFENSYAELPSRFFEFLKPSPVRQPRLICLNEKLAERLRLNPSLLQDEEGIEILAGNLVPPGADPLAMAYAGFQFGHWVPQLGDGRAILLGEIMDKFGIRHDIQLKGAGRTPFSRMGDGRSALGPVLREYLVSEAMAALGIKTTRSLAAVFTGEQVMREAMLPGAILTRVASSHVRVGTFQYFSAREDVDALALLSNYIMKRHFPSDMSSSDPHMSLLASVIDAQATLITDWQLIGFIHGVMNTDNMSIAGETIDYGPCAFMDTFDPQKVYSSIDRMGRYAYCNQPPIAHWNIAGFAQTLLPLLSKDGSDMITEVTDVVNTFPQRFQHHYRPKLMRKIGLLDLCEANDRLAEDLFSCMSDGQADFTLTFRRLSDLKRIATAADDAFIDLFSGNSNILDWLARWRARLATENRSDIDRTIDMKTVNPLFIPRNHLIEEVIRAAVDHNDLNPFNQLLNVISRPYDEQSHMKKYAEPPMPDQIVMQTFCGT